MFIWRKSNHNYYVINDTTDREPYCLCDNMADADLICKALNNL